MYTMENSVIILIRFRQKTKGQKVRERSRKMSYIDIIKEKARQDKKTIVMPETNDKRR